MSNTVRMMISALIAFTLLVDLVVISQFDMISRIVFILLGHILCFILGCLYAYNTPGNKGEFTRDSLEE